MAQRGIKIADNIQFQFQGKEYGTGSLWDLYTETISGMKHIIYAEVNGFWFALMKEHGIPLFESKGSDYPIMQGLPPDDEQQLPEKQHEETI